MKKIYILIILAVIFITKLQAQNDTTLNVFLNDSSIENSIQNSFIGDYINVSNISINIPLDSGAFALFIDSSNTLDIHSGLVFSTGDVNSINNPVSLNASSVIEDSILTDPDLEVLTGLSVTEAIVIEFDYVPYTNLMSFSYILGSEEFPEYVNAGYNDVFGFFVSGEGINGTFSNNAENIAIIPGTASTPVSIDNIYPTAYYIDNEQEGYPIVFDGLTTALDATLKVVPFSTYHIKLAVGDVGDMSYDTGVFLKDNSFSSEPLSYYLNSQAIDNQSKTTPELAIEDSTIITVEVELPLVAKSDITYHFAILGTAENGVDYETIADSITIPQDSIKASFTITALADEIVEDIENIVLVFDYLNDTIVINIEDNTDVNTKIDLLNSSKIQIHPNPAHDFVIVNIPEESRVLSQSLEFYNTQGQLVKKFKINNSELKIQISDLPKGIYLMKIGEQIQKIIVE